MNTRNSLAMDSILNPELSSKKKNAPVNFTVGMILDDKYEIKREIARGGMGIVYEAYHRYVHRKVAVKVIIATKINETQIERFKTEIEAYSLLSHPNVIQIYDAGMYENNPYLVMEYIEGIDILQYATQQKKTLENLDPNIYWKLCTQLIYQVALGLEHIHQNSIIHRDIKPSNIIVKPNGSPVILDLGLAKLLQENYASLTMHGEHVGTPQYMSLEQVQGTEIDARSDIYSLGLVLYELLTGEIAYSGKTMMEIFYKIMEYYPPTPRQLNPEVPTELEKITMHAIEKNKEERYATAKEFAEALKQYLRELNSNAITKVDEVNDAIKQLNNNNTESKTQNNSVKTRKLTQQLESLRKQQRLQEKQRQLQEKQKPNQKYYIAGIVALLLLGIIIGSITGTKENKPPIVEQKQENISVKPVESNTPAPQENKVKEKQEEPQMTKEEALKKASNYATGKTKNLKKAIEYYEIVANQGDIKDKFKLAEMYYKYYKENSTTQNALKAKEIYETLAQEGYDEAKLQLNNIQLQLGIRYFENKDYIEAVNYLTPLAENGNTEAKLYLGLLYCSGEGLYNNTEKATRYFNEASTNNIEAQYYLALIHYNKEDYIQAKHYFEAIAGDIEEASLYLELIKAKELYNNKKYKEAKDDFEVIELSNSEIAEAQSEVAEAQLYLGIMYADGLLEQQNNKKETKVIDTPKDNKKQKKETIKKQETKKDTSKYNTKKGSTSKKDKEREKKLQEREKEQREREKKQRDNEQKAKEYFDKSSKNGNAEATLYLASMYTMGKGVEQSFPQAIELYKKAKGQWQGNKKVEEIADNMLKMLNSTK